MKKPNLPPAAAAVPRLRDRQLPSSSHLSPDYQLTTGLWRRKKEEGRGKKRKKQQQQKTHLDVG